MYHFIRTTQVFFVLRQKWSQMTFLHVYHHANMAVTTWFYLKYIWGRHIVILAIINVFIHVLMYSYYLLSSLGPAIRPYLWWKPYLTQMQLGQFLLVLAYVGTLAYNGCEAQPTFIYFSAFNVTSFLLLFINFYRKAYGTKASSNSIHRTKAQ